MFLLANRRPKDCQVPANRGGFVGCLKRLPRSLACKTYSVSNEQAAMSESGAGTVKYADHFINVRGLQLHYVDYGGYGEVVLALHGLLQNAHAFDSIAPLLVPHVRLLALDLPGRGGSEWAPPGRYKLTQYLLDLGIFLTKLGVPRFALIGTSLGGWMARMYATAHPERVTRLVLNDCAVGANLAAAADTVRRMVRGPAEFASIAEATRWFLAKRDGLECLDDEALTAWVGHYLSPTEAGGLRFNCDPLVLRAAELGAEMLALRAGTRRQPSDGGVAWEQVKRLTMPVLILRGARSEVVPRWTVARLVRILPRAESVEVPGAGHSPTLYEDSAQEALRVFFGIRLAEPRGLEAGMPSDNGASGKSEIWPAASYKP
jgi:esterase